MPHISNHSWTFTISYVLSYMATSLLIFVFSKIFEAVPRYIKVSRYSFVCLL